MSGYYLLNTNTSFKPECNDDMILHNKAAAYLERRDQIEKLEKGDIVFLYRSKVGVIAYGTVSGELETKGYSEPPTNQYDKEGEYSKELSGLGIVEPPLTAAQLRSIIGENHPLMGTMYKIKPEYGERLLEKCGGR